MADSLVLASVIELLGGGVASALPQCPGAVFRLGRGGDFGAAKPETDVLASLLLDGERQTGRRAANRQLIIPVTILAPSRPVLDAAREVFLQAVDSQQFTLVYTREGSPGPLIFDCYRATEAGMVTDISGERQLIARGAATFAASPYGRSDVLTTLNFPSPSAGWTLPPQPVRADDYSTVSTTTQGAWWSQSSAHLADSYSAHWDWSATDRQSPPTYTRTLGAPADITNLPKLTLNVGLGTENYSYWHAGPVAFSITLTDNAAHTLTLGGSSDCTASNSVNSPRWNTVTFAIPTSGSFDYAHVTAYSVKMWRKVDWGGHLIMDADTYLNGLTAIPAATAPIAAVRGALYQLGDPGGTARAPVNFQFQSAPTSSLAQQTWASAGTYTFTVPAGVYALKVRVKGATGKGGDRTTSGAGGGAGGGAGSGLDVYPVTPGQSIPIVIGAAGSSGGYPTLAATYWTSEDAWNAKTLYSPSFTPNANDLLVVKAMDSDTQAFGTLSGGGLSWTKQVEIGNTSRTRVAIWTATVGASPSAMTVQLPMGSGSQNHGMLVERWANAKVAGSPAVYSGSGSGTGPSGTVTTVAANSVVSWCCGDYDHDGGQHPPGSKTYRGTPTEEQYWLPGDCVGYFAWQTAASAGAQTIGLSAPTNQSWQMVGIEVQAFNTGALTDGGLSTFDGPANFLAAGGKSVPVNTATGGAGGLASASVCPAGGVKYSGGNGFTASTTGGGAGSSAGDDAAGNNAASQTGASAPTGGIAGGNGGNAGGNNGGSVPGGGAFSTGGNASGANGADGKCQIWYTPPLTAFKTLIVHAPGWDAPDTFSPMIPAGGGLDAPNGTIEYLVPSPVPGLAARFGGTYTIVAVLSNVASPGSSRDITATFTQYDYPGGPSSTAAVTRTLTPSSESPPIVNGVVVLGEVFLPCRDIAPDQTAAYTTVKVNSTQGSDRVLDILALDVTGQVVIINSATGKVNYYLDAPEGVASIGRYLGSDYDRAQASSVLDSVLALSGGPLTIDPGGPGWLLAYSHDPPGAPALNGTFYPRWRDARLT